MKTIVILLLFLVDMTFADLITYPKDTEALVGASAFFNCSTTLHSDEIQWFHYSVGNDQNRRLVYGFDQLYDSFQGRCTIEVNQGTGQYNLVIGSVSIEDAGKFECQDDKGRGAKGSAQLSVLQTAPACESNMRDQEIIGPNCAGIDPEVLNLSCTADYRGNQPPQMVWKRSGSNDAIKGVTHKTFNDTRVTYSLTLKSSDNVDGQTFVCETTKSTTAQYGCNSGTVRVIGTVQCTSNTVVIISFTLFGVSVLLVIVFCAMWAISCNKNRKLVEEATAGEHYEMIRPNCYTEEPQVKLELERLRTENKRLSSKVSEYEERLYSSMQDIHFKENPQLIDATPVQKGKGVIKGITILSDELFAIFEKSPVIFVYDSKTFRQNSNSLPVDDLWNAQDITSCSKIKCLYVIDQLKNTPESHLLKIDPKRNHPVERWEKIDCHRGRLSAYESNIIVCLTEKRVITKYSANGETLQSIRLSPSDGFDYLCCAIQVTESKFIVSNYNTNKKLQSLCLVGGDGKVTQTFNKGDIPTVICLVCDSEKSVLTLLQNAKKGSRKTKDLVLLLDHKLDNKRTLIEHSADECGVKMCLDETGSRLFVAVNSYEPTTGISHSGKILFYNIR